MDYKMKSMASIAEILKSYTGDYEGPWSVAYSGGKDSTVTLALVIRALLLLKPEQRNRKVFITSSDTTLDLTTTPTRNNELRRIQKLIENHHLPVEVALVAPEDRNSFWFKTLGLGYPLPKSKRNRWCTDALKIKPQEKFLQGLKPSLTLLGVRISESQTRGESIKNHQTSKYYSDGAMMPIVDFTLDDIWSYLAIEKLPWGDAEEISQLYKDATGECGLSKRKAGADEDNSDACGARFGCIVCPVVKIDKSTQEIAKKKPWFQPYADIRDVMIQMYQDPDNKAGYRRNGEYLGYGQGTFTVKARMKLLELVKQAQEDNRLLSRMYGVEPQPVISDELIDLIHQQWEKDLIDYPFLEDVKELGDFYEVRIGKVFQLTMNLKVKKVAN
ncbi:phosphoadenosine phosphosulfate reductase family protein [Brevibacillus nitrificans]|uniref:phosphoadenosine phosphosulfate reductase domain-containing protein n=1 Tax=Brevibacillus nitrificans TaxID=651560 RepID=UPI0028561EEE|nr:phosphoadenosine phosphosulfate reductase family protein [Brevibacillus nitrificans]MDR7318935.1 DNA sulfur modification protein DndC [Brevibacillus nitrificans]